MHMQTVVDGVVSLGSAGEGGGGGGSFVPRFGALTRSIDFMHSCCVSVRRMLPGISEPRPQGRGGGRQIRDLTGLATGVLFVSFFGSYVTLLALG